MQSFPVSPLEDADFPASFQEQNIALLTQIAGGTPGPPLPIQSTPVYDTVSGGPAYLVVFDDGTAGYYSDPEGTTPLPGVIPGDPPVVSPPVIVSESSYVHDTVSDGPSYLVVFSDGTTGFYADPQGTTPMPGVVPGKELEKSTGPPIVSESSYVYDTVSGGPAYLVVFDDGFVGYYSNPDGTSPLSGVIPGDPPAGPAIVSESIYVYDTVSQGPAYLVVFSDGTTGYYSDPQGTTPLAGVIPGEPASGETDLSLSVVTGTNTSIPSGFKSVTIANLTGTTTINGGFGIGEDHSLSAISFGTNRGNYTNEILPAYTIAGGTWEWIGHN